MAATIFSPPTEHNKRPSDTDAVVNAINKNYAKDAQLTTHRNSANKSMVVLTSEQYELITSQPDTDIIDFTHTTGSDQTCIDITDVTDTSDTVNKSPKKRRRPPFIYLKSSVYFFLTCVCFFIKQQGPICSRANQLYY